MPTKNRGKSASARIRLCGRLPSQPGVPPRHRESKSAAAKRELSQSQGPEKPVARVRNDGRHVHCEYEDQECHSDQGRCQPCLHEDGDAECRAKKSQAHQVDPKRMGGNPAWDEGRDTCGDREMLGAKNGQGNRKEQAAKRHDLIDAVFLRQFSENLDEASNEEQRRGNVNPECRRRNAKWRGSQSKHDDTDLLEISQENLQRCAPPHDFEGKESKAASQREQSDVT
jgi:hypothetical protein